MEYVEKTGKERYKKNKSKEEKTFSSLQNLWAIFYKKTFISDGMLLFPVKWWNLGPFHTSPLLSETCDGVNSPTGSPAFFWASSSCQFCPRLRVKQQVFDTASMSCSLLIQPVCFPALSDLCLKCKECFNHAPIIPMIAAPFLQQCPSLQNINHVIFLGPEKLETWSQPVALHPYFIVVVFFIFYFFLMDAWIGLLSGSVAFRQLS